MMDNDGINFNTWLKKDFSFIVDLFLNRSDYKIDTYINVL